MVALLQGALPGTGYLLLGMPSRATSSGLAFASVLASYHWRTGDGATEMYQTNATFPLVELTYFSIYDVYRRAGGPAPGDRLDDDRPGFWELARAPFDLDSYRSWRTLAPIALIAGLAVHDLARDGVASDLRASDLWIGLPLLAVQTTLVGVGEESLFRGVTLPAARQATGSALAGNALQAAYFGSCHTPFGRWICPPWGLKPVMRATRSDGDSASLNVAMSTRDWGELAATGAIGFWLGQVATREPQGLRRAVAVHAVWDFLYLSRQLLSHRSARPFIVTAGLRW
jgi:membrane protease YdiL (CAAX protease family)